jgi:CO/xanthine dehydrogenase Mo-binding subunit
MAGLVLLLGAGSYRLPELRARFRLIYTNSTPTGAFRGVSGVAIYNSIEQHMDHIARELSVDPRAYRLRMLLEDGGALPNGQVLEDASISREAFEAVETVAPWTVLQREKKPLEGIGIATGVWLTNPLPGSATVKFNEDGSVHVVTGAVDIGTGAVAQGLVQIVAEELALDPEEVHLAVPDTDVAGYDGGAQGSRTTRAVGRAAQTAAVAARTRLFETAAPLLGACATDLELLDGIIRDTSQPDRRLPLPDVLAAAAFGSGAIVGTGRYGEAPVAFDPERARGLAFPALPTPTYHVHLAKVAIDPTTGVIRVLRYVVAQEVGRAINPAAVAGQIQGGVAQGIGYALYEGLRLEAGRYHERNLKNYRLPLAADIPEVELQILEHPDAEGPFGAKGAAEPPLVFVPAAIGNAVADALGVRFHKIPITPEDVMEVLEARGIEA